MDQKMKRFIIYYLAAGILAGLCLSGALLAYRHKTVLSQTDANLQIVKANKARMLEAAMRTKEIVALSKAMVTKPATGNLAEEKIALALDDIAARLKNSEITIAEYNKMEMTMPIALRGEIHDYMDFVNTLGYFQSLHFPIFILNEVSLAAKNDDETKTNRCLYSITGVLKIPAVSLEGTP